MLKKSMSIYEDKDDGRKVENLQFYDCYKMEDKIFFSAQERNGLFCFRTNEKIAEFIFHFEEEDIFQKNLHRKVFKKNNKLYFVPHYGHCIHIVDLKDMSQKAIKVAEIKDGSVNYSNAFMVGDEIWLIPSFSKCQLVRFDILTEKMENVEGLWNEMQKSQTDVEHKWIEIYCSEMIEGCIFCTILGSKILVKYEINTKTFDSIILKENIAMSSISFIDGFLWSSLVDSYDVVRISKETGEVEYYKNDTTNLTRYPFVNIVKIGSKIVALAGYDDRCFEIDIEQKKVHELCINTAEEYQRITSDYMLFTGIKYYKGEIWLLPRGLNRLLILDEELKLIDSIQVSIDVFELQELLKTKDVRVEGIDDCLNLFL